MRNDDRVGDASATVAGAAARSESEGARTAEEREAITAEALAACSPRVCDAVLRGEIAMGMNEAQVLAATRTTERAWSLRRAGDATVFVPRSLVDPPSDIVGDVVLVQLADHAVSRVGYREAQGIRVVDSERDASTEGRAEALAEALLREGDDLAARGDLDSALDRYDRASILTPDDPMLEYRIASVLDKQLRPIEALIQYRLFLHELELERIEARGRAAGHLADAIAQARQRIIVLEKHEE